LVVPLDGSALGEHALPLALHIAKLSGAEIDLVYVHLPPYPPLLGGGKARYKGFNMLLMRPMYEYLDDVYKRIARASSVRINPLLLERYSISDALREIAAAKADLVVMATRARGRLKRLLTGSVAETLVDKAGVPVLLVRGTKAKADLDSSVSLRHALVPLDGSPEAERILGPLVALGQLDETEQTLLRVLPFPRYSPELRTCFSVCEFAAEQHDRALSGLDNSADGLRSHLPRVKTDVVFSDKAPGLLPKC
jgi:nucleotide-binding universal stress UspA family protein